VSPARQAFFDEIARWRDSGRQVEFWWRDDDAARPDRALSRLFDLARRLATPLALAAVPLLAEREVFEGLGPLVTVLQHGTDHVNRALPGGKKTEFAANEPPAEAIDRLAAARRRLESLAGKRFVPVLAPPWNRLPPQLAPHLAAAGYCGLSQYGARKRAEPASGLRQVNSHVDVIAWRADRAFIGEEHALGAATNHLAAKRMAEADAQEATGWLTHHAVHDEATWAFLERLFESTSDLPMVAWRRPEELFRTL
jgi:hypothetical protein